MTPFRDNGHLNNHQIRYNIIHARARSIIERAYALLKGKFRRLKYLDMNVDNAQDTIITCCCLHNIILINEKDCESLEDFQEQYAENDSLIHSRQEENGNAKRKRIEIMNNL
ncbi:Uncharacterised protein g8057 [Pycnogonum litorale]